MQRTTSTFSVRLRLAGRLVLPAFMLSLAPAIESPVLARQQEQAESTYIGVVTADDVFIRSGAADSYYAFAKVSTGDLVQVTGEKFDWVRVAAIGPAFTNVLGYVKHDAKDTSRLRLSADGLSAMTLGRTDVLAPNLDVDSRNQMSSSWKPIVRLEPEQPLQIVETMSTEREVVHKVILPASATGWIHKKFITRAGEQQARQWRDMMASAASASNETARPAKAGNAPTASGVTPGAANENQTTAAADTAVPTTDDGAANQGATLIAAETEMPGEGAVDAGAVPAVAEEPKVKEVTLDDLEAALKQLQKEDPATAELEPLQGLFVDFADRHATDMPKQSRYAKARANQLAVWMDVQNERTQAHDAHARAKSTGDETVAARKMLDSGAEYAAVGRLTASTIYDGKRLPKMLRLQDAGTGRTVAYVRMKEDDHDLASMISQIIGIVGEKTYDDVLRLNIVTPRRIDILAPNTETVAVPTDRAVPGQK